MSELDKLERGQTHDESMMIAALIRHGDLAVADNALSEAARTTGLRIPVGMDYDNGVLLAAVMTLLEAQARLSADSITDQALSVGDDVPSSLVAEVCTVAAEDVELTPFPYARRIAEASAKRLHLGQRVWPEKLYRWYDWDDRLLYIGITRDLAGRQEAHAKRSSWARFAAVCNVERYPDRASAEVAERTAIETEQPLFNHVYNDTPEARQRLVEYLVENGHLDLLAPAVGRG